MNPFKVKAALGYSTGSRLYPLIKQLLTLKVNSQNCPPVEIRVFNGGNGSSDLADELTSITDDLFQVAVTDTGSPLPWQIGQTGSGPNPFGPAITTLLNVLINIPGSSGKHVRIIDSGGRNWYVPIGGSSGILTVEFGNIDLRGNWSAFLVDGDPPNVPFTVSVTDVTASLSGLQMFGGGGLSTIPSNPGFVSGDNMPITFGESGNFELFASYGTRVEVQTISGGGTIHVMDSLGIDQTLSNLVPGTYVFNNVHIIQGLPWSILID